MNLYLLFLGLASFELVSTYKVLVYSPAFGNSHSNFLGKISDILIDAGNDVTLLIPVFLKSKGDLVGSKKVKKIVRIGNDPRVDQSNKESRAEEIMNEKTWEMETDTASVFGLLTNLSNNAARQCEYNFQHTEVLEQLKHEQFDLGISESFLMCGHAIFEHIGIETVINADSTLYTDGTKYSLGEPAATSYYPGLFSPKMDETKILDRFKNLGGHLFSNKLSFSMSINEFEHIKPYYKSKRATREELISKVAYNMVNSNQYLDYPSPVLPKTVFIGGMQVNTKNSGKVTLDKEWDDLLNKRQKNVLISFGTMVLSSGMPEEFKAAFLKVFESIPDTTFIWKFEIENSTIADHLSNVKLSTWVPQNALLADDRLSLFVTHGGLGSTMELAYQGKPAIVIPVMGDQSRNAHMLTRHGGAIEFDRTKLNKPSEIKKAIETVLNDDNYRKNAKKLAQILESQPNQPKDVVLKHCDFAVKFGPLETLNSSGRHLNVLQYYSIDIALIFLGLLLFILVVLFVVIRAVIKFVIRKFLTASSTKNKND